MDTARGKWPIIWEYIILPSADWSTRRREKNQYSRPDTISLFGMYSGEDMIGAKIAEEIQRLNLGLNIDIVGHSLGGGNAVSMTMLAPGVRFRDLYTIDAVCAASFCRRIGPNVQRNYNWWQTNQWWFPHGGRNTAAMGATVTIFNRSMTHLNLNHSTIVPPALQFIRSQYGIGP